MGRHLILELYDCDPALVSDTRRIERIMLQAAKATRAHIIDSVFHRFNPHGVSGVVVIAESHLAIHTWPEFNFASIDIYTCGAVIDPWQAMAFLKQRFKAKKVSAIELKRGLIPKSGASQK